MTRMFAPDRGCVGATLERSGRSYDNDRAGFVHVEDPADVRALKAAGYVVAGSTPRTSRGWLCECGWEAWIRHCPRCDRDDLERMAS